MAKPKPPPFPKPARPAQPPRPQPGASMLCAALALAIVTAPTGAQQNIDGANFMLPNCAPVAGIVPAPTVYIEGACATVGRGASAHFRGPKTVNFRSCLFFTAPLQSHVTPIQHRRKSKGHDHNQ
jgi:hypothetical protein